MKRWLTVLAVLLLLLTGCATPALPQTQAPDGKKFTATFLDVFDTVTTIMGACKSVGKPG